MVVVVSVVAVSVADTLEVESAAVEVELALVQRASQVAFRTLLVEGPGSLHLGVHHIASLSIMDELIDP